MNMLNSAKKFAMKNKEKIAAGVDKATDAIDKKTHGKYHDKLEKADDAAAKFAGKPKETPATEAAPDATPDATPDGEAPVAATDAPAADADAT
jgi:MT0933-like antitoxin protein